MVRDSASHETGPKIEALANILSGRVADKWTMLILKALEQKERCGSPGRARSWPASARRCSPGTPRQMERDGLATRTVHAVVSPKVGYRLTGLGLSLGAAFCGVWAAEHLDRVDQARRAFDGKARTP